MDFSIVDTIQELGYSFTNNQEECTNALLSINSSIKEQLSPALVARILGMMAKTHNILQGEVISSLRIQSLFVLFLLILTGLLLPFCREVSGPRTTRTLGTAKSSCSLFKKW